MEKFTKPTNNHIEWHDERLKRRSDELGEALRGNYLSGERLEQVQREMAHIAFEQWARRQDRIKQETEEAYNERARTTG